MASIVLDYKDWVSAGKTEKVEDGLLLTAAYDALADTFGDLVYIGRDDYRAKCPFCGDWSCLFVHESNIECFGCGRVSSVSDISDRWVGIKVTTLLEDGAVEFFLPRAWNKNGNWIGRDELAAKYEEFIKEREHVRSSKG